MDMAVHEQAFWIWLANGKNYNISASITGMPLEKVMQLSRDADWEKRYSDLLDAAIKEERRKIEEEQGKIKKDARKIYNDFHKVLESVIEAFKSENMIEHDPDTGEYIFTGTVRDIKVGDLTKIFELFGKFHGLTQQRDTAPVSVQIVNQIDMMSDEQRRLIEAARK